MRVLFSFAAAAFVMLASWPAHSSETAQVRMYCVSVRLETATDQYGDVLSVNSTGTAGGAGELLPYGQPPQREIDLPPVILYNSIATLDDAVFGTFVDSSFSLYLPELVDLNTNGYPDFFEVSQGIDTNSYNGSYNFGSFVGNGPIYTTWKRTAGSASGTCNLTLPNYLSSFTHTFDILEYTGSLTYTPGTNAVSATLSLKQTGAPTNTFRGSLKFLKSSTDHFNTLTLQAGSLADASLQTHWFTNHTFLRNLSWPTNYSGYVEFDDDGTQNTPYPYAFWVLSITDTNDINNNGIPDFSDDAPNPPVIPPRVPQLSLSLTSTNLLLSISGDTGHVHTVQTTPQFPAAWQDVLSLTLTNDPQIVPLSFSGTNRFWRVMAQ